MLGSLKDCRDKFPDAIVLWPLFFGVYFGGALRTIESQHPPALEHSYAMIAVHEC